jgi:hypothetical protein
LSDDYGQFQEFLRRGHERAPKLYGGFVGRLTPLPIKGIPPEEKPKPEVAPHPAAQVPVDFKSRASGEKDDDEAEVAGEVEEGQAFEPVE